MPQKLPYLLLSLSLSSCVIHYDPANVKSPSPKIGKDSCLVTNECPKRCLFIDDGPYRYGRYTCQ